MFGIWSKIKDKCIISIKSFMDSLRISNTINLISSKISKYLKKWKFGENW